MKDTISVNSVELKLQELTEIASGIENDLDSLRQMLSLVQASDEAKGLGEAAQSLENALRLIQEALDNSELIAEEVVEAHEQEQADEEE